MNEFIAQIAQLPTAVYTVALLVAFAYWVFVLLGVFSTELFDGLDGADGVLDGAADGVFDGAADGVLDGALDGAADGVLDGAADAAFDGVAEGAGDGLVEGVGDALDGALEAGSALSFSTMVGRDNAPFTVIYSLLCLFSWFFSIAGMRYLDPLLSAALPGWLSGLLVAIGAFALATPVTRGLSRPLRPLFRGQPGQSASDMLGALCEIETGRVDLGFGMATIQEGDSAGSKVHVRARTPNGLKRGDTALLVRWSKADHAFWVEALPDPAAQTQAQRKPRSQAVKQ